MEHFRRNDIRQARRMRNRQKVCASSNGRLTASSCSFNSTMFYTLDKLLHFISRKKCRPCSECNSSFSIRGHLAKTRPHSQAFIYTQDFLIFLSFYVHAHLKLEPRGFRCVTVIKLLSISDVMGDGLKSYTRQSVKRIRHQITDNE